MATTKKYDVAVKTGSYTDSTGQTKNRYQNIGAVMQGDNGPYLLLDPLINLAAVPREAGKDRVICSLFEPRQDGQQPRAAAPAQRTGSHGMPMHPQHIDDDSVPF